MLREPWGRATGRRHRDDHDDAAAGAAVFFFVNFLFLESQPPAASQESRSLLHTPPLRRSRVKCREGRAAAGKVDYRGRKIRDTVRTAGRQAGRPRRGEGGRSLPKSKQARYYYYLAIFEEEEEKQGRGKRQGGNGGRSITHIAAHSQHTTRQPSCGTRRGFCHRGRATWAYWSSTTPGR